MAGDDGRIPCPQCGGLVHPVAGRCKHCKHDLAAMRTGRAAAPMPLPSLQQGPHASGLLQSPVPAMIAAIAPNPIAMPQYSPQPILPPRITGRSIAAQAPRATWKSWPMLVIVLASVAIIIALVMMVWPPSPADAGKHIVQPPAPERMSTDPLPPAGAGNTNGADPWGGHSQADPPVAPRQTPDPLPQAPLPGNQAQPDPLGDPFGGIGGIGGLGGLASPNGTDVMMAAMSHACTKLKSCPNADDTIASLCDTVAMFPRSAPPSCDAAKRCFDAIDKLDCTADLSSSPLGMVNTVQDCMKAATTC